MQYRNRVYYSKWLYHWDALVSIDRFFFNEKYLRQYNSSDDSDNSEEWSIRVEDDIREK